MTMKDDLASRSADIHWPEGFDPANADLFSHNELDIDAPCERIWQHIIDATRWPEWYPNSKDVHLLNGAKVLGADTTWRWTTFGLPLESKVHEHVPYTRLGWYGYAPGAKPTFYHTWYLTPRGGGSHVVTDEVGIGNDAAHLRQSDEGMMHRGHDLWLATLKWVAESRQRDLK
jgi:uncharacterized protein YndB with AHSA1/START domain